MGDIFQVLWGLPKIPFNSARNGAHSQTMVLGRLGWWLRLQWKVNPQDQEQSCATDRQTPSNSSSKIWERLFRVKCYCWSKASIWEWGTRTSGRRSICLEWVITQRKNHSRKWTEQVWLGVSKKKQWPLWRHSDRWWAGWKRVDRRGASEAQTQMPPQPPGGPLRTRPLGQLRQRQACFGMETAQGQEPASSHYQGEGEQKTPQQTQLDREIFRANGQEDPQWDPHIRCMCAMHKTWVRQNDCQPGAQKSTLGRPGEDAKVWVDSSGWPMDDRVHALLLSPAQIKVKGQGQISHIETHCTTMSPYFSIVLG